MPYLTPETLPPTLHCRRLLIPDSSEWLAIISGALTELTLTWNWQQKGITVDQALEASRDIIASYYNQPCTNPDECTQPDGSPVIRRNADGTTQQLINGTWQAPTGDLTPIPPEPREEPTEEDRLCLAAKNAANILGLTYAAAEEAYFETGTAEAVVTAIIGAAAIIFAPFVTPMTIAALGLLQLIFDTFFDIWGALTEPVWDDELEAKLACTLLSVASEDGDERVTFDFEQLQIKLVTDWVNTLHYPEYLLGLQMQYLTQILGAEALNWSSGTTAIIDDDCSYCGCTTYDDNMDINQGALDHVVPYAGISNAWGGAAQAGEWISVGGRTGGGCWNSANIGTYAGHARRQSCLIIDLGAEYLVDSVSFWHKEQSNGQANGRGVNYYGASLNVVYSNGSSAGGTSTTWRKFSTNMPQSGVRYIRIFDDAVNSQTPETYLDDILVTYC